LIKLESLLKILIMLIYTVISYWRVKRKIGTAVLLRDNIYQSETVISPFVLGIIKPKIYLPFSMNEQDVTHVIAHEQAHIRRKDHWWKPIGFLLLSLHWFNPLMWLGYVLLCRDIELACDEKVIKELDTEQKADYSQALLVCSVNRRMIAACPLAFGEIGVKNRVKSILNYKKPAFWICVVAVVVCIVTAVCFLTNPLNDTELKNRSFGVEKWYFEYMIGEDRANKENMNWQIRIDDAGVVTFLVEHESTWVERGKLEPIADPSVWEMVKEKLPFYYRHLNVRQAYAALDAESGNATTLFVTKNNLIFQAYMPSYTTEDMYVHEVCKIKKIATLVPSDDVGQSPDNSETDQTRTSGKKTTSTQIGSTTKPSSSATTTTPKPSSSTTTTTTAPSQPSSVKFTPIEAYTNCPQVQVSIKEIKQQEGSVFVVIEKDNQTDTDLSFGAKLNLYREEGSTKVDCCPENYRWQSIGYTQLAGSTMQRTIDLSGFDVFVEGNYHLQYMFSIEKQQYRADIDFSVSLD